MVQHLHEKGNKHLTSVYHQILRAGTSISANIGESQFAQSPADFITKLHIALKEASETRRWLNVLKEGQCITPYSMKACQQIWMKSLRCLLLPLKHQRKIKVL